MGDNKKTEHTYVYSVICRVVPPARIELAIDPYHGSVIPLN